MTFVTMYLYYRDNKKKVCNDLNDIIWETFGGKRPYDFGYLTNCVSNQYIFSLHKLKNRLLCTGLFIDRVYVDDHILFNKLKLKLMDNFLKKGYVGYISEPELSFQYPKNDVYYFWIGIKDIIIPDDQLSEKQLYNKLVKDKSLSYTEKMFRLLQYHRQKFNLAGMKISTYNTKSKNKSDRKDEVELALKTMFEMMNPKFKSNCMKLEFNKKEVKDIQSSD